MLTTTPFYKKNPYFRKSTFTSLQKTDFRKSIAGNKTELILTNLLYSMKIPLFFGTHQIFENQNHSRRVISYSKHKKYNLLLMEHFLKKCCHEEKKPVKLLSPEVKELLLSYQWPGNVRELENTVEYMVSLENSDIITRNSVPPRIRKAIDSGDISDKPLATLLEEYEKELFKKKLDQLGGLPGQIDELGKTLQISRATLYRKLKKYGFLKS